MTAQRWVGFISIGVLFSLSVVETFCFPLSRSFASIPMLIGLVTIGMGHGAFDSELIFSGKGRSESIRLLLRYTGVMILAAMGFGLFPVLAIVAFLLLAMIHFGKEDSESYFNPTSRADAEGGRREPTDSFAQGRAATGKMIRSLRLSHGWLVITVPLAANPIESAEFFRRVEGIVGHAATLFPWEIAVVGPMLVMTTAVYLVVTLPHHLMQCGWLKLGLKRGARDLGRALAGESVAAGCAMVGAGMIGGVLS